MEGDPCGGPGIRSGDRTAADLLNTGASPVPQLWDRALQHVARLPEELNRRGQLLLASLAVCHSDDGVLGSVLADPRRDPLLYLPAWALSDQGPSRDRLSLTIAEAAALQFASADLLYTDQGTEAIHLAEVLTSEADSLFRSAVGDDEAFWRQKHSMWRRYTDLLTSVEVDGQELIDADRAVVLHAVVGAAIDAVAGNGWRIASAAAHAGAALAIDRDLSHIRADLEAGATTIATLAAWAAAGSSDDPELVHLIAAGRHVHHHLLDLGLRHARLAVEALAGLPRLSRYAAPLVARLRRKRASLGAAPPLAPQPYLRGNRRTGMTSWMAQAVQNAQDFLLADPTLREAREVHRRQDLDRAVTSSFPKAFPLEALVRWGATGPEPVDRWVEEAASRSFSYYDDPRFTGLDADSVGAVLRLWRYATQDQATSSAIRALMGRVSAAVQDRDRIPVWLERPAGGRIRLVGEGCAAVEANFLVGLLEGSPDDFQKLGAAPLARLWSDFAARGTGDATDYVSDYFLVPLSRLLVSGQDPGDAARARLQGEIERRGGTSSPQTAAFLTMAASVHPDTEVGAWPWMQLLARTQRHDGGWDAEPLFWVNGFQGAPEWFKSRTVTTAFCYQALGVFVASAGPGVASLQGRP